MTNPVDRDLEERVARLERVVEDLLAATTRPRPAQLPTPPRPQPDRPRAPADRPTVQPVPEVSKPPSAVETPEPSPYVAGGEKWLSRVGVAFVILAVAFLLKLSFDRGWITPGVRLAASFVIAVALLIAGLSLEPSRKRLAQALMGGAVALLYLVGFAGYQLYELVPLWISLALMSTTTLLAFVLAERQDSSVLGIVGVAGGLATPFLLATGSSNPTGLAIYVGLVLIGGGAVQFHRGWPLLLGVLLIGGAAALAPLGFRTGGGSAFIPILAVGVFWTVTAVSCIARPLWASDAATVSPDGDLWSSRAVVVASTLAAVVLVYVLLGIGLRGLGLILGTLAIVAALTAREVRGTRLSEWLSAELAALCLAIAFLLISQSQVAMFASVAEAAVLFIMVQRGAPASLRPLGHALVVAAVVAFYLLSVNAAVESGGAHEGAFVRLATLAMIAVTSLLVERDAAPIYKGAAYVGLLAWFLSELAPRPHGMALVSIAWAVQGAVALLASLGTGSRPLQLGGLLTLGLVAAKLLMIDLSQLDAVWRILMFLGFGAALLGLAYLVNRPARRVSGHSGTVSG